MSTKTNRTDTRRPTDRKRSRAAKLETARRREIRAAKYAGSNR